MSTRKARETIDKSDFVKLEDNSWKCLVCNKILTSSNTSNLKVHLNSKLHIQNKEKLLKEILPGRFILETKQTVEEQSKLLICWHKDLCKRLVANQATNVDALTNFLEKCKSEFVNKYFFLIREKFSRKLEATIDYLGDDSEYKCLNFEVYVRELIAEKEEFKFISIFNEFSSLTDDLKQEFYNNIIIEWKETDLLENKFVQYYNNLMKNILFSIEKKNTKVPNLLLKFKEQYYRDTEQQRFDNAAIIQERINELYLDYPNHRILNEINENLDNLWDKMLKFGMKPKTLSVMVLEEIAKLSNIDIISKYGQLKDWIWSIRTYETNYDEKELKDAEMKIEIAIVAGRVELTEANINNYKEYLDKEGKSDKNELLALEYDKEISNLKAIGASPTRLIEKFEEKKKSLLALAYIESKNEEENNKSTRVSKKDKLEAEKITNEKIEKLKLKEGERKNRIMKEILKGDMIDLD